jgi:hypothetical protein
MDKLLFWLGLGAQSALGCFARRRYSDCGADNCRSVSSFGQPTMSPAALKIWSVIGLAAPAGLASVVIPLLRRIRKLRRVHWSKETSGLRFAFVYRSTPRKKLSCYRIIGTLVEAIIRRWCCHVGGNDFISPWQVVISIWQHCSLHRHTVLSITAKMSIPITETAVYVMSHDGTRQTK